MTKVIVDLGSSVDVVYYKAFKKMGYKAQNLAPFKEVVYGFTNTLAPIIGTINLKESSQPQKK